MAGLTAFAIGYVLSQFFRNFLAVLTPSLIVDLGVTKTDLSIASGIWFLSFALMQLVVGVSLDRFGPRRTSSLLMTVFGASGCFCLAVATSSEMLILSMLLMGIGCSAALMGPVYIFARDYSPARFALLTSMMVGIGNLGNVFGASPLAYAIDLYGWRNVLLALCVFTFLIGVSLYVLVRDPAKTDGDRQGTVGFGGYLELLSIRALWPLIPLSAVNFAAVVGVRGLWAGTYLTDVHAADTFTIGRVTLAMACAMVVGNFLYGPLDQIFKTRKWVAFVGNLIGVSALLAFAFFPSSNIATITVIFVVMALAGASYGLLMAHARAFFPAHLTGRGATLMNLFTMAGVGLMQLFSGFVVTANFDPAEPTIAYVSLFIFYAIMLSGALAIYLFAKDAPPVRS